MFFKVVGYSYVNVFVIISIFGLISFFYIVYVNILDLKNKEFIFVYCLFGVLLMWILMYIIFVENIWFNLIFFLDNLLLNMFVLVVLLFFNIKNVEELLNIGNIFKDLIVDLLNIGYILFVIVIISFFIIINKIFSIVMYRNLRVRE